MNENAVITVAARTPISAPDARIIAPLIHALQCQCQSKDVAGLCIGGSEATAVALELG